MDKTNLALLPSVTDLLKITKISNYQQVVGKHLLTEIIRQSIALTRQQFLLGDHQAIADTKQENITKLLLDIETRISEKQAVSLKRVINATGVILHTNLGRAVLSEKAKANLTQVGTGYSNLEYDIKAGTRGSRYDHLVRLIKELTGAEDALIVNNNAAAVLLVLDTLAKNKEVVVSRGELVEIGGSFRIPSIIEASGCVLKEVGTTNKTHFSDFSEAITEETGVILKVHTSNYKIVGFSQTVTRNKLASLALTHNLPYVEDLGSGLLIDLSPYGLSYEATVSEVVSTGADIVTFSGDKILGGPQAGIIVGKRRYISPIKQNQLTRCLRVDKMVLAALEGTLNLYRDDTIALKTIPTLQLLTRPLEEIERTAKKWQKKLEEKKLPLKITLLTVNSQVGGGAYPGEYLKSKALRVMPTDLSANQLENTMRLRNIPIIVRIKDDAILLDVRTIFEDEWDYIVATLVDIFS